MKTFALEDRFTKFLDSLISLARVVAAFIASGTKTWGVLFRTEIEGLFSARKPSRDVNAPVGRLHLINKFGISIIGAGK